MEGELRVWWVLRGPEKFGPYTRSELQAMAADGNVVSTDLVWKEGMKAPVPAATLAGLGFAPQAPDAVGGANENPYRAPGSVMEDRQSAMSGFGTEARRVGAGHGSQWLSEAWEIFNRSRLIWLVSPLVMWVCLFITALIPVLGSLLQYMASVIFSAGFIAMAHAASEGQDADISHLFDGFRQKFASLALLGVINIGLLVAFIGIPLFLLVGSSVLTDTHDPQAFVKHLGDHLSIGGILLFVLIALVGGMCFSAANWFAPALIMLSNVSPVQALSASFKASMQNWLPLLVYSLTLMLVMIGGLIVVALIGVGLASVSKILGGFIAGLLAFAGVFTMAAVLPIALYTSFRDLFAQRGI